MTCVVSERELTFTFVKPLSQKSPSGKLRDPYMWKALIRDKGIAKCIWPLCGKSIGIPEDDVKQSTEVGPSLLYVNFYRAAECRRGLVMRILSVCSSVRPSVCLSNAWIMIKRTKNLSIFLYYTKDRGQFSLLINVRRRRKTNMHSSSKSNLASSSKKIRRVDVKTAASSSQTIKGSRRTFINISCDLFTAITYIKIPVAYLIISYKNCGQWRRRIFQLSGHSQGTRV